MIEPNERMRQLDAGRSAVARYEDEHGAFSDAEREWARAYLDDPRTRIPDDELAQGASVRKSPRPVMEFYGARHGFAEPGTGP